MNGASLQTIILGLVQGITEFLPISSSGHLLLARHVFGWQGFSLLFDVLLHCATLAVVIFYFRGRIARLFALRTRASRLLCAHIVLTSVATAIIGLAAERALPLGSLVYAGYSYLGTALLIVLLYLYERLRARRRAEERLEGRPERLAGKQAEGRAEGLAQRQTEERAEGRGAEEQPAGRVIDWKIALLVGVFQGIAVLPGISRAGATIVIARLCGVSSERAFEYSFLVAIPAIVGALALQLLEGDSVASLSPYALSLGVIAAMVRGYLALRVLRYLNVNARMTLFVPYLLLLSLFCFVL